MKASLPPTARMTAEEYLTRERLAESKSEFVDGLIYSMAGGSPRHATIQMNIQVEVGLQLRRKTCQAFTSELKVRAPAANSFFYPDLSVVCDPPTYFERDALENPKFLLEVLSPSTERFDRTSKFAMYRSIPSFAQYALVSQDEPRVEVLTKSPEGFWIYTDYAGLDSIASFSAIGVDVPLSAIYDRVVFEPAPDGPRS